MMKLSMQSNNSGVDHSTKNWSAVSAKLHHFLQYSAVRAMFLHDHEESCVGSSWQLIFTHMGTIPLTNILKFQT